MIDCTQITTLVQRITFDWRTRYIDRVDTIWPADRAGVSQSHKRSAQPPTRQLCARVDRNRATPEHLYRDRNDRANRALPTHWITVYPKKYAHGFCFAVLCCGYTLTDFPISTRLTSLALWQSDDCPSASKATLMNMDKHFTWIHYERLHNHNKAKHNKTVYIFLGIYCTNSIRHCDGDHKHKKPRI